MQPLIYSGVEGEDILYWLNNIELIAPNNNSTEEKKSRSISLYLDKS